MGFLQMSAVLFLGISMAFVCSSQGYVFHVGGKHGWSANPPEDYNKWAERNRFQVNDTIVFKYDKGQNSVLVVSGDDYYKCNVENPIQKYADGNTELKFDRSGSFFFIGGSADFCREGQRLIVVVLAVRNAPQPPPTPTVPGRQSPASSPAPAPHASAPGLARPVAWVLAGVVFCVSVVLGNLGGFFV